MSTFQRPLVSIDRLSKVYGFHRIFQDVSFHLKARERAALVGPNGVGKSTLLRLLAGIETPSGGAIRWTKERPLVAYLPQQPEFGADRRVDELVEEAATRAAVRPGALAGALRRFGFNDADAGRPFSSLSGGEKTRVSLLLHTFREPDLLLLDEPTNHLDEEGLAWLERFVLDFRGSLFIVSHDRAFLDRVAERILELGPHGVREYPGNYTAYRNAREEERRSQEAAYAAEQKRIRRLEEAIERQRAWAEKAHREAGKKSDIRSAVPGERVRAKKLARAAKARIRRLESLKEQSVEKPRRDPTIKGMRFTGEESGRRLVLAEGLSKRFDKLLFEKADFSILYGEKVGLIGANGSGKTTLIRMICGSEPPSAGALWTSPALRIGLLDQEVARLDFSRTVLDEALSVLTHRTRDEITRIRTLLHGFLFGADDLEKRVAALSVGERKRLALIKLTLSEMNLLIMDEPTDHLDAIARERLEEVLIAYEGTLLFTSHDRALLERVSTRILSIEGGTIVSYPGGYREYRMRRNSGGNRPPSTAPSAGGANAEEERLLIETRLAHLGGELARIPQEDPLYLELEAEYLRLARRLKGIRK